MPTPTRRPPWLLAAPPVALVAALAGWLLLADDGAPVGPTRTGVERPGDGRTGPAVEPLAPGRQGPARPATGAAGAGAATSGGDAGPVVAASDGPVVIDGRVIDPDGRPIPGAQVIAAGLRGEELGPVIAVADAAGRFRLDALPPTGLLEVVAERFARRVLALEPVARALDVVLAPARGLKGRVVAAEDERPLGGALVEGEAASWRARVKTGPDGWFAFDDVPDGERAALVVTAAGRQGVVVEEAEAALVRLSLGRGVRGRVVGPDGAPVAGAVVFVLGADQLAHPHATRADADGRWEATGLGEDEACAVLAFGAAGGEELATPFDLVWLDPPGGPAPDELLTTLSRLRVVEVRGAPAEVAAALVPVSCPPGVPAGAPRAGRRAGDALRFEAVVPGAWQLEVRGRPVGEAIDVPVGDPAQPVVVAWPAGVDGPVAPLARRPGVLRVRVLDETGRPVVGATVVVAAMGSDDQEVRQTGRDGVAEVADPPGGLLMLSAHVPGRVLVAPATWDAPGAGLAELVLARPVELAGVVRAPVPGAHAFVTVHAPDGSVLRSVQAQPDGRFRMTDLPPGPVLVEVHADGCAPRELQVQLPLAGELVVPLEAMGDEHDHHDHDGHDHHDHGPRGRG
ncbi:MAG: carboxypeptidase-like regulatory domain-containing protein [Planctomycetes bacterium]|nr:carboxypeptidase-like regulatory domain-containing protein [Planctomycetota bacterium]